MGPSELVLFRGTFLIAKPPFQVSSYRLLNRGNRTAEVLGLRQGEWLWLHTSVIAFGGEN